MARIFATSSLLQTVQRIALVTLALFLLSSVTTGHIIHKRHDIIDAFGNETAVLPENDAPAQPGDVEEAPIPKDVINNEENNNVNNVQDSKVASTTDVNNGIEQNFAGHINSTSTVNETIASSSQANFTKDFSQDDSVENRLPSTSSNKEATSIKAPSKPATKVDENKETHSTASIPRVASSNPSEKPKRLDTTFARSTEREVSDLDTSTVPVSRSTASILSTIPLAPRISATETIRARISSISPDVAEKRAKYLSETSSPSPVGQDASWSDLKTVGEVHHNNVTLGKSSAHEEPVRVAVNGKIDSEEVAEKVSDGASSTEKSADDHETQLQKSNSSRIVDVQEDNSLSSLQSSSNRPTLSVTTRRGPTKASASLGAGGESTQQVVIKEEKPKEEADVESPRVETSSVRVQKKKILNVDPPNVKAQSVKITETTIPVGFTTTEHLKSEESTERVTENDVYSTTEDEFTTTDDAGETTILDETTTLSHVPKKSKSKENLGEETTTFIPTTNADEAVPTTVTSAKQEEEVKVHHEPTQSAVPKETSAILTTTISNQTTASKETIASNRSSTMPVSSTTPSVTKVSTAQTAQEVTKTSPHPTKPIVTKPTSTELNQRIIVPTNDGKVSEPTSTTQQNVPQTISTVMRPTGNESIEKEQGTNMARGAFPSTDVNGSHADESTQAPEHQTEIAQVPDGDGTDINAMIAIGISVVAVVTLILLVGFLFVMRKRQKQLTYGQRCRPIGLDAYSLDNISVYNSVRRKSAIRSSKRAFGNAGFDDPGLKNNPLNISQLATFATKRVSINDEFRDVPTVTARIEEVPVGCEDKNRYANVVPLPESRVHLKQIDDDEKTEYINANFVKGPKDTSHFYIATQAPLEHTIVDFWRMIWEQNSRVIIMATDLTENGIEKCAEYLPSSFVIDNHVTFGDYQVILKNREVRDKYAVSTVHLKNACTKTWREITHFWYQWPENGVPTDEASVIAMLLEARSYLKMVTPEQSTENGQQESELDIKSSNGHLDKTKSLQKTQGPLTVHCSPGTGRTGTIIACDIAIRSLEQPTRTVDVPQIVYFVRRGRASAVQTREQYEFIYKVAHVYATKLTGTAADN